MFNRCFQVNLPDFNQLEYSAQQMLTANLATLFTVSRHLRLLSYTRPWSPDDLLGRYIAAARRRPHAWQRDCMQDEGVLVQQLANTYTFFTVDHCILAQDEMSEAQLRSYNLDVDERLPSAPLAGAYHEAWERSPGAYLAPVHADGRRDTNRPVAKLLWAQKYRDRWDQLAPMAAMLTNAAGPLVVCVDIAQVGDSKVRRTLEEYESSAGTRLGGGNLEIGYGYQAIKTMTEESPVVVETRLLVLLLAPSVRKLAERTDAFISGTQQWVQWDRLIAHQAAAYRYFTPDDAPPARFAFPQSPLMAALSFCGMWGVGRHYPPDGVLAGLRKPIHSSRFSGLYTIASRENQVNHRTILGRQGSGKTAASMTLDLREAARGVKQIYIEPQGNVHRLKPLLGDSCAVYNVRLGDLQINPLDLQFIHGTAQQIYFKRLLWLLVSLVQHTGGTQASFGFDIQAAIDRSFNSVYAAYRVEELYGRPQNTPLFQEFVHNLLIEPESAVRTFGRWLEANFVNGPWASVFNQRTTLDLHFTTPVTAFNFLGVAPEEYPLLYFLLLTNIDRIVFSPDVAPGVGRITIDEYRHMSSAGLSAAAARLVKRARARGWSVTTIDQDIQSFVGIGGSGGRDEIENNVMILQNNNQILFGKTSSAALPEVTRLFPDLRQEHLDFMVQARPGEFVVYTPEHIETVYVPLTPREQEHLL